MDNKNKKIITKENLLNIIFKKCNSDFISTDDLFELIDKATDDNGIISKKKLIKSIRDSHTKSVIKNVYNALEDSLFETISSVDRKNDICIKLFEGISLSSVFVPEDFKKNNLTGKVSFVSSHIKPKFNITRSYREKLNNK